MKPSLFDSEAKGWIKVSAVGFLASYAFSTSLGFAFPSQIGGLIQAFIDFLGGAKGGIWTNEQIFWHVLIWNMLVVCVILGMGGPSPVIHISNILRILRRIDGWNMVLSTWGFIQSLDTDYGSMGHTWMDRSSLHDLCQRHHHENRHRSIWNKE